MVVVISLILYVAAAVCFVLALANVGTRVNLIAAGLLAWVLVNLVHAIAAVA